MLGICFAPVEFGKGRASDFGSCDHFAHDFIDKVLRVVPGLRPDEPGRFAAVESRVEGPESRAGNRLALDA